MDFNDKEGQIQIWANNIYLQVLEVPGLAFQI